MDTRTPIPLKAFLQTLSDDGIALTSRDYTRIALVLQTGAPGTPWTVARLKMVLVSLLANNEEQQDAIARRFDAFFTLPDDAEAPFAEVDLQRALDDLRDLAQQMPPALPRQDRPARRPRPAHPTPTQTRWQRLRESWPGVALLALAALLVPVVVLIYRSGTEQPVAVSPTVVTLTPTPDRATPTLTPTAATITPTATPNTDTTTITPAPVMAGGASDRNVGQRVYTAVPHASVTYAPLRPTSGWQIPATLAGTCLILALVYGSFLWRWRRVPKDDPARYDPDKPRRFSPGSIGGAPAPRLDNAVLDYLADAMGFFQSDEGGHDLDVSATIRATMQRGGTPHLLFHRRKQVRSLIILDDALADARDWDQLPRELALGIARRGVPVQYGTFRGTPDHFVTDDGVVHWLEDLDDNRQGYLLLIFTDGKNLDRFALPFVLEALAHWPMIAWLDRRDLHFWDETARLPTLYGIPIYPATPAGLEHVAQQMLTEQGQSSDYTDYARTASGPPLQYGMVFDAYVEHHLGDALPWAQACALVQPVSHGLADSIRQCFHSDVPPERYERLVMLPGTQRNVAGLRFSEDVLAVLRRSFLNRRSEQERNAVLDFILQQIEAARPTDDNEHVDEESLAFLAWEVVYERVRLERDPDAALVRLAQLVQTPLEGAIHASLDGYGPPDQPDPDTIPVCAMPQTPPGRQRFAHITGGDRFGIPLLDAFPVAVGHWIVLAVLLLASLGAAAWSIRTALQPPEQSWVLASADQATGVYGILEQQNTTTGSSGEYTWETVTGPISLTGLLNEPLLSGETYRLRLYDGHGVHTAETFAAGSRYHTLDLAPHEVVRPCYDDQSFAASGVVVHRCPSHTRSISETVDYGTWHTHTQRLAPEHQDDTHNYLHSVGIELDSGEPLSPTQPLEQAAWRDLLLWSNSVDVVYQICPDDAGEWHIADAVQDIQRDLGPFLHHAQVLVWGDTPRTSDVAAALHATTDIPCVVALDDDALAQLADELHPDTNIQEPHDEQVVQHEGAVLFRPATRHGIVVVTTDGTPADVTFTRTTGSGGEPLQVQARNGERVALLPGEWHVLAETSLYNLIDRNIVVQAGDEQVVVPYPLYPVTPDEWRVEIARSNTTLTREGDHYWRYVPGGTYTIGGWTDDEWSNNDEQAEVELNDYWVGKYPVTVAQYRVFIEAGGYDNEHYWTPDGWQWRQENNITSPYWWPGVNPHDRFNVEDDQPVIGVSWYEATAFTAWLSEQLAEESDGTSIRLPTEAEWEVAAVYDAAGQRHTYPWGDTPEPDSTLADFGKDWETDAPASVGGRPNGAAACGAQDMAGSVWEWMGSSWDSYPESVFVLSNTRFALRGGGWYFPLVNLRSSSRYDNPPDLRNNLLGFRPARHLP